MSAADPIVVLGAGSLVADYLLPRLAERTASIHAVSRRQPSLPPGIATVRYEALLSGEWPLPPRASVVSLLPLEALIPLLPCLSAARDIVALGSTRRFSNQASSDEHERAAAAALAAAEGELAAWCAAHGVTFTVLRPTLIYDMRRDMNLARMAGFIARYGVLPVARPARGLRQPVHADDVAKAIVGALGNTAAHGRFFNIAGGERLTYRAMAERVFASLGRPPRLLPLPLGLLAFGFRTAGRLGLIRTPSVGLAVFQRMNEDLVFDVADGLQVLGYEPRDFDPSRRDAAVGRVTATPPAGRSA